MGHVEGLPAVFNPGNIAATKGFMDKCPPKYALAALAMHLVGKWGTVWKRFRRWALRGEFERIFAALADDPDFEYALIDGTIVKVHRHGAGAKGGLKIRPLAGRAAG